MAVPITSSTKTPLRVHQNGVTRVAIIGGGKGGTALMEIFAEDPLVKIVGLAEIRKSTRGIRLARQLRIPVTRDYRTLLRRKNVDLVIDVTGNPDVERALMQVQAPQLAIVGGASAKFMWQLIEARIRATTEIERTLSRYQSLFRLYVKEEAESAVNDERTRIACEIHDGLVQTLVGVNFKLDRCRELAQYDPTQCAGMLNQTRKQLKHAIQEARQVIYNLRPGHYENLELVPALSNYLRSYEQQYRIRTELHAVCDESRIASKTKVFLFRMVQEALSNVRQHAKASRVIVKVRMRPRDMVVTIKDNGQGFNVQTVFQDPEKWDHFGLRGMMERARMLGGEVVWDSKRDQGTRVTIRVPTETTETESYGEKNESLDCR